MRSDAKRRARLRHCGHACWLGTYGSSSDAMLFLHIPLAFIVLYAFSTELAQLQLSRCRA